MKENRIKILMVISITLILIGYYYPQQFDKFVMPSEKIIIVKTEPSWSENRPDLKMSLYEFLPGTDSYSGLIEIFNKYSYRRNLRSLFLMNGIDGVMNTYSIYVYNDTDFVDFFISDQGQVIINNHIHKIGFLGKARQLALIDDINALLAAETPVKES